VQLWVLLGASALCLGVLLALAALEFEFDGRALGEANGHWACAFGVAVLGVVVSGVCAKQQPLRLDLRVFGRSFPLAKGGAKPKREPKAEPEPRGKRLRWPLRQVPVLEAVEFLLEESGRIELQSVDVELTYGFEDISLNGKLAGLLYALSGALPPQVRLVQHVRWDGAERWEVSASGHIALWPGRVLFDAIWYMLRTRLRSPAPSAPAPIPP